LCSIAEDALRRAREQTVQAVRLSGGVDPLHSLLPGQHVDLVLGESVVDQLADSRRRLVRVVDDAHQRALPGGG
jgi:hypothetical protein